MSRRIAFPFLTVVDHAVSQGDWMIGTAGEPLFPGSTILEFWDYDRDLEVRHELSVDLVQAADSVDLSPDDLDVVAVLKVGTGSGITPRTIRHTVESPVDRADGRAALGISLESSCLSSRLWLEASLVLASAPSSPGPLSPRQTGSRLWSSSIDILLEDGGNSRLPIESMSFSKAFPGKRFEDAFWLVDWRPHAWESDFAGSVRLYLNRDRERFFKSVLEDNPLALHMIMSDLMAQVVSAYLMSSASEAPEEHHDGSLARQAHDWLSLAFPGLDVSGAKTLLDEKPGEFRSAIQVAAEVEVEA